MSFTVHSGNEGILKDPLIQTYIRNSEKVGTGVAHHGVPQRSNTNAHAERCVRSAVESIQKQLFQANLPHGFWHIAALHTSIENGRQHDLLPLLNTVHPVPFGTLGRAVLPKDIIKSDKFDSRMDPLCRFFWELDLRRLEGYLCSTVEEDC